MKPFAWSLFLIAFPSTLFAAEPVRVACVGDSITHGVGAGPGWAWPEQLDRMMGQGYDVRGFGHSGATVGQLDKNSYWNQKEYKNALAFRPDIVVILLGTNDSKPDNWKEKGDFPKLYRELIGSFAKLPSHPKIYCGTPPFVPGKGNFGINNPVILEQIPIIQTAAKEMKAEVVDVHAATENQDKLFPDKVHPNTEGATLIAKAVYASLMGKSFAGAVPALAEAGSKPRAMILKVENPGAMTYRDTFAYMATELTLTEAERAKLKGKFDATAGVLELRVRELEYRIAEEDGTRMHFKHAKDEDGQRLSGEAKGRVKKLKEELEGAKAGAVADLLAQLPDAQKPVWGGIVLRKYVEDSLVSVAGVLTIQQRQELKEICSSRGADFLALKVDFEREAYREKLLADVVAKVLTPEQRKRI